MSFGTVERENVFVEFCLNYVGFRNKPIRIARIPLYSILEESIPDFLMTFSHCFNCNVVVNTQTGNPNREDLNSNDLDDVQPESKHNHTYIDIDAENNARTEDSDAQNNCDTNDKDDVKQPLTSDAESSTTLTSTLTTVGDSGSTPPVSSVEQHS